MKLPHRRHFLHLAAGAAALPVVSRFARAQSYPSRPLRLIIGYPPGGSADTTVKRKGCERHRFDAPDPFRKSGGPKCCDAQHGFSTMW